MDKKQFIIRILKVSSFFIFFGRAYQHLFWDGPYRSLFWDQSLLESVVNKLLNVPWESYVTNLKTDNAIQLLTRLIGVLYLSCAVLSLIITKTSKKWIFNTLKVGAVSLVFLALLLTKDKFYHLIMFFEHTIQFGVPIALIYYLKHENHKNLMLFLKIAIALAFTCHGMYALGVLYPLPGNFVTMTMNVLPVNETIAKNLLFTAGILDFIISIAIFIPRVSKPVLIYAAFWGIITALARIMSGLHYDFSIQIIHQYLYPVIYRIPHGLIPLLVYLYIKENNNYNLLINKKTSIKKASH